MATHVDISETNITVLTPPKFVIDIPQGLTIAQMVRLGNHNWANGHIQERFSSNQVLVGKWECELVEPKKLISSESANALCTEGDWQSAQVDHLLLFGATYPEVQCKNCVVGLGSSCQWLDAQLVPVLYRYGTGRKLNLSFWGIGWDSDCVFLRVRRLSA